MNKRANGEGSIIKRKDGRFMAAIMVGEKPDGSPDRRYYYGRTQREVKETLTKVRGELLNGAPILKNNSQTFGAFLDDFLAYKKTTVSASSLKRYAGAIDNHIKPLLGKIELRKINAMTIQSYMTFKQDELQPNRNKYADIPPKKLSPRTLRFIREVINTALIQASKWDLIPYSPVSKTQPPKLNKREMKCFNADETTRFIEAVKGSPHEAFYLIAVSMGLRAGEILALRWNSINFDEGTMTVAYTLHRNGKKWQDGKSYELGMPKTDRSRRTLFMPAFVHQALQNQKANLLMQRLMTGEGWNDDAFIFATSKGNPIVLENIRSRFHTILEKAGLPKIRLHDLRHSAASILLQSGVPITEVSRMLGHAQVSMTLNVYSHIDIESKKRVAEKMQELFGKTG